MNKVFVVQETPYNIAPASEFGEIHVILTDHKSTHHEKIERLHQVLSAFEERDYILPVGDPVMIGVAIAICLCNFQAVRVLRWSKERYKYEIQEIWIDE